MSVEEAFVRNRARQLYWQGYPPAEISRLMGINQNTVYTWRKRDGWDETPPVQRVTTSIDARLVQLTAKEKKTGGDFKEIDLLTRQLKKLDNGKPATQPKKKLRKKQNFFSESQISALRENIVRALAWHQQEWWDNHHHRNRMILKSRQVGATWYFAREALLRALSDDVKYTHQRNQIFLSASRRQAYQFRTFIRSAAAEVDVELKGGDMIQLFNGAELHFLGTSAATAQSYTGNLYFDEFFWVGQFANLRKVAGAMATLKGLTRTYFSTPSAETHEAYPFWTGEAFNKGRSASNRYEFDTSWKALSSGLMCPDNIWRQIVTLQDAIDHGWELTDIDEIQRENSPEEYQNLYNCQFIRTGDSVFNYNALLACGVDGYDEWSDWKPYSPRPLADRPVWIGYDPNGGSGNGDSGGLSVVAAPLVSGGSFRTIETKRLRGRTFEEQAKVIIELLGKYNVQHIGIDGSGIGEAVHQIVRNAFPAAVLYRFSPSSKNMLVLKMQQLIRGGRWEFDKGEYDLITAFTSVRKIVTPGGMVTYSTDRARGVSHGDLAWATMLATVNEPIGAEGRGGMKVMEY